MQRLLDLLAVLDLIVQLFGHLLDLLRAVGCF